MDNKACEHADEPCNCSDELMLEDLDTVTGGMGGISGMSTATGSNAINMIGGAGGIP